MKVVAVTGANRGLGRTYVEQLLKDSDHWKVILTARDAQQGQDAVQEIIQTTGASERLVFRQLDISSSESILAFRDYIAAEFGSIDILVANAAIALGTYDAPTILETNLIKTAELTDLILPLIKPNGQVIVVSSDLGNQKFVSNESLKARVLSDDLTREQLWALVEEYLEDVRNGETEAKGWPSHYGGFYPTSKLLLNAYVRLLARELRQANSSVRVNALCPGWCRTNLGGPQAPRSPEQGVETYLTLTKHEGPESGLFWSESQVASF